MVGDQYSRRAFLRTAATAPILAATAATASAQETTPTTHTVDMTDGLVFAPDTLTISPGDTVVWENVGNVGHSVTAYEDELPTDAAYWASGGFSSESAARSGYPQQGNVAGGESYQHRFDVEGQYGYFCIPHESTGMLGQISVQVGGAPTPGPAPQPVPSGAVVIGIATTIALVTVLLFAFFLLKYGGDYEGDDKGFARPR
ncbi:MULTISPECIES: plastocyanin/azurin family copper-binding protein [unclassified Haladaptatus]|uniref:plastocyanin/azurin family copper-binding protein n=1 Tax=unclassified Haladaptatus TaxID=2622732 RepID=UPI0023E7B165|nr:MULTISPECIES: plastocyanin/azurin family copper-binding protein [unclassified Haladaptatus]